MLITLTVIFLLTTVFLVKEMLKKFGFMKQFVENSNMLVSWKYQHLDLGSQKPGMRNIVLRGQKPFSVLVGFRLDIPVLGHSGFDYYGFVSSNQDGVAVFSTYLGKGDCDFQFFVNTDLEENPITVTSTVADQDLVPYATYPPHWWQKLGFFG